MFQKLKFAIQKDKYGREDKYRKEGKNCFQFLNLSKMVKKLLICENMSIGKKR